MPEKAEVYTICRQLNEQLAGRQVYCWIISPRINGELWARAREEQPIFTIDQVRDHGKYILISINNSELLISHLGMTGKWLFEPLPNKKSRGEITIVNTNNKVYFYDDRTLGFFEYYSNIRNALTDLKLKTGLDWLKCAREWQSSNNNPTKLKFIDIISKSKKNVCAWLMDQGPHFCGIGNYLKSEILYSECLNPNLKMNQIESDQRGSLYDSICKIIICATIGRGLSIRDYVDTEGEKGKFRCFVYNRETDPWGNSIIKTENNGRTTHWVPNVQTTPININILDKVRDLCNKRYFYYCKQENK